VRKHLRGGLAHLITIHRLAELLHRLSGLGGGDALLLKVFD
jgi:hypothetical protein